MRFDFTNDKGEVLSGVLELPAGPPRALALFAHCFTCSKDSVAAATIAKTLTQHGLGVLRFDFTGLGASQGDFSDTNFSSNVEDLLAACDKLAQEYEAPQLLLGHSLGGTAVLKAAGSLEAVKAVVTIGTPAHAGHVAGVLDRDFERIEQEGQAEVDLGGRKFLIKKQFLDDIKNAGELPGLSSFRKALLVMHAPFDTIVSIDQASQIFKAAKHPKSFVTLDSADHLLSRRSDARYAASVIAAWVERYLSPPEEEAGGQEKIVRVQSRQGKRFTQDIVAGRHHVVADEPSSAEGDDLGLNPYQLLLAGLGACTSMTMRMYARRKNIPLKGVTVDLHHEKIHAEDCRSCESRQGKIDRIVKSIVMEGDLDDEQRERLLAIAEKCPVNRTLQSEILIESDHRDGSS